MNKLKFSLFACVLLFPLIVFSQPAFTIENTEGDNGTTVEVDFTVDNFEKIVTFQFSMNWDSLVLEYSDVINLNTDLPGFSASANFSSPPTQDQGVTTVSWFDPAAVGITVPDGSVLFTLVFNVVGQECDSSKVAITDDPLQIEVAEEGEVPVGLTSSGGNFLVPGDNCVFTGISITGSQEVGNNGENVCVQFTANGINNLGTAQFGLSFDPAVLSFTNVQNFGLPGLSAGNFGTTNAENGELTFLWFDQNGTGVTLPDGTVLFEVCFDIVGGAGQMSVINYTPIPSGPIEIADIDGNILDVQLNPGKVTAQGGNVEGFALFSADTCGAPNSNVCVDITSQDFIDIISFQGSIGFDSTVLEYIGSENFNIPDFSEANIGTPAAPGVDNGQLSFAWFDNSVQGVTVPDGVPLFTLCFKIIGSIGESSVISFGSDPLTLEISDVSGAILVPTEVEGSVDIDPDCSACGFSVDEVNNPACTGDMNGNIQISVFGCPAPITYLWSNGETTQDISGLGPGMYTVTITTGDNQILVPGTITLVDPDPINTTTIITDPSGGLDNGAIDLSAMGGSEPYGYLWSNGEMTEDINDLAEGQYFVTITDANKCEFIGGPFTLGSDIGCSITDIQCFGQSTGAIDLTPTFGSGPYSYLWNDNATSEDRTGLTAGEYCVTVTDNNSATATKCITITAPESAITVIAAITNDDDDNGMGAIDLSVSGGQGPYDFFWDNAEITEDLVGLSRGQYCVTVTDDRGCEYLECFNVLGKELQVLLSSTDFNGFGVSCFGECDGNIQSSVNNGVGNLTYSWSSGESTASISNLCAGVYIVTVTDDGGQTATALIELNSPELITIVDQSNPPSAGGATDGSIQITVTGGVPAYMYDWNDPNGSTTPNLQNLSAGEYLVVVSDQNGCQAMHPVDLFGFDECFQAISVITPNGDDKNEEFIIACATNENNRLHIFDRWGQRVFMMDNYDNSWNGVDLDNDPIVDGGYHWVLEVFLTNGDTRVFKGTVSVVRSLK